MDSDLNPYTPGSGVRPLHFAGRADEIAAMNTLVKRASRGLPGRSLMLTGLRGVGKTVLLNRLREVADDGRWFTVQFEASSGKRGEAAARKALGAGLAKATLRFKARAQTRKLGSMLATVTSFNMSMGAEGLTLGVERDPSTASSGNIEVDLIDLVESVCAALSDEGSAFGVFIDEIQDLDAELLEALVAAQHHASQRNLPFFVVGAGLPGTPARLADARSYAERLFDYREIGRLPVQEAMAAMEGPARQVGGGFTTECLTHLVAASGCYPYFIQEFGSAIWQVAQRAPFTVEDARIAVALGVSKLDNGFFRSRWDRATPAEREYLVAMSEDRGLDSQSSVVAQRLDREVASLGPARANLIAKGLIYSPERGKISFTVPSFHEYIERRAEQDGLA